jgi:hypothetical protein
MDELPPRTKIQLHPTTPGVYHLRAMGSETTECGLPAKRVLADDDPGDRAPCWVCFEPAPGSELHFDLETGRHV